MYPMPITPPRLRAPLEPVQLPDFTKAVTLSSFFPAGTNYFYGYPIGTASGFLNTLSVHGQELIATRALACAGPTVSVINFPGALRDVPDDIRQAFGVPQLRPSQLVLLPDLPKGLTDEQRNRAVREALALQVPAGSFIMAQPYIDADVRHLFQIPSELTYRLNDKRAMTDFIDDDWRPARLATYQSGRAFAATPAPALPCVVKMSSSSSGDGVIICTDAASLTKAKATFRDIKGTVFVEEYVPIGQEFGIQFGIPAANSQPIRILGISQGFTNAAGHFIGGIIRPADLPSDMSAVTRYLEQTVLPRIRGLGWHGVGGLDVIRSTTGRYYIIDCNFRMTAMTPFHMLVASGKLPPSLLSFTASFRGDKNELLQQLGPLAGVGARKRSVHITALTKHQDTWHLNGALVYASRRELPLQAAALLQHNVASESLTQIAAM